MLEREGADVPLTVQADLLSINRTSLYYKPVAPPAAEVHLKHRIAALFTAHPY